MRARYYSPELMRFLSEDSVIGSLDKVGSLNRYAFCGGNPVGYIDPSGNDMIFITAEKAVPVGNGYLGHTSVMAQDVNGNWYYFFWGSNAAILKEAPESASKSLSNINEWICREDYYTSGMYFCGDFSNTIENYKKLINGVMKDGENSKYDNKTFNCLQASLYGLEGVLSTGEKFYDVLMKAYNDTIELASDGSRAKEFIAKFCAAIFPNSFKVIVDSMDNGENIRKLEK